jgi:hypothetical protein
MLGSEHYLSIRRSDQLHTLAALSPRDEPIGPIGRDLFLDCSSHKTNSVVLSAQGKYTDRSTDICRRILVLIFADRGVSRGQRGGTPTAVNLSFLDRSRYFFIQVAPHLSSQGLSGPRSRPIATQKSSAENRTRDLWACSQEL